MNPPGPRDPASYSAQELADPRIDSMTLRQIGAVRPDLWRLIHDHPNCDRELAEYIRRNTPPVPPSQPQTGAQPHGLQQPTGPQQQPHGFQPPGAHPQGQPPHGGQPGQTSQGAQQIASGAKELAKGAKTYFTTTVAPAAVGAAQTVSQRSGQAPGAVHWSIWFRFAIPALALVAIISLFLPLASVSYAGRSASVNYFSPDAPEGEGAVMLALFVVVIVFGVVSLVTGKKWALITAAVIAIIAGLFGMINGLGTASSVNSQGIGSVGAGAIFLGLAGLALVASAVVTLLPQKQQPTPPQPHPWPGSQGPGNHGPNAAPGNYGHNTGPESQGPGAGPGGGV
ncbi:hypothetical protein [Nocardiopsis sp. SBT366]|uniref:variant leucine-rich repeat-containing protein n=1 Tax=Nocardiopsis sp. SBT366 TaxID=1580529 RepID=UPI000ABA42A2|nr:hypothetical protein [Nocardiopsis sp. SBT366]